MGKRKTATSPANDPPPAAARRPKRPAKAKTEEMKEPEPAPPVTASSPANEPPEAKIENVEDKAPAESSNSGKIPEIDSDEFAEEPNEEMMQEAELEEIAETEEVLDLGPRRRGKRVAAAAVEVADEQPPNQEDCELMEPFTEKEARENWPNRYQIDQKGSDKASSSRSNGNDTDEVMKAQLHYRKAKVDGIEYKLNDDAFVQGEEDKPDYICKIIELFMGLDKVMYFRACWYYRAEDTVISEVHSNLVTDEKRIFLSEVQDDNSLDCLVKPLKIARIPFNIDDVVKQTVIETSDFYYDQMYLIPHCTFICIEPDHVDATTMDCNLSAKTTLDSESQIELSMLDLYSGCGAMSTGLCLGSNIEGVKLVTKWAVDMNKHACHSLKKNHPETEVRNEPAEDFLKLLEEWRLICGSFKLIEGPSHPVVKPSEDEEEDTEEFEQEDDDDGDAVLGDSDIFEVEEVIGICFKNDKGLCFKVQWKGYTADYDTWEPFDCLSGCPEKLKEFIFKAYHQRLLPLPGSVDVICGGPPCQGISGFNRFRNTDDPLADPKNEQMRVYMEIVEYLKPRFVLMENVVDLLKFCGGHLGRYAIARLVQMRYQARLGLVAAGAYGLAQYRMRVFLWASLQSEKLPQFPLPTHEVVVRGNVPVEFQECFVGFEDGSAPDLQPKLFLQDVISDLPAVTNNHAADEMGYSGPALSDFQKAIRLAKDVLPGFLHDGLVPDPPRLFDHRPLKLNVDDYDRVCLIPRQKGANFRNLAGVKVTNNVAEIDKSIDRPLLRSGKPLVPDYAISFVKGTSSKPFGRLWWDETVPTVVTRAEPHNQVILHPTQNRVLTIRENARLQGFSDFYKLEGPVKERYMQVGNAVAIPVARALGHSLALAAKGISGNAPVYFLPPGFPFFPIED